MKNALDSASMSLSAVKTDPVPRARERLAALFKAAGDPLRLDILRVLSDNSFGVQELCEIFAMRQSGMSHHLKVLATAGLVTTRREGNSIFYRRALPRHENITGTPQRAIFEALDAEPLETALQQRVDALQRQRAERSRAFFTRNADRFDESQDLIADYDQYGEVACALLDQALPAGGEAALEVGPGEGQFLLELARRFHQVEGLDNSTAMLGRAQRRVDAADADNVSLRQGDWPGEPDEGKFNCVVLNMVLHHLPAPAGSFRKAAALLAPGGVMLVTELSRHDQAWARESCGDLWLGFDGEDLDAWADQAGLRPGADQFIGQRNGFQVQVRSYASADWQ